MTNEIENTDIPPSTATDIIQKLEIGIHQFDIQVDSKQVGQATIEKERY